MQTQESFCTDGNLHRLILLAVPLCVIAQHLHEDLFENK